MKKYRDYFAFLKSDWFFVLLGVAFNLTFGLVSTISAEYMKKITDELEDGKANLLLPLIVTGGVLAFLAYVARWLGAIVPQLLAERFSYETRIKIFNHLTKIPFIRYEAYQTGQLQSIIQNDSRQSGQMLYTILSRILNNVFLFGFSIWMMAKTDMGVTAAAVLIVIAATAINQLILARMKRHNLAAQQNLAEMTSSLEKTFSGVETVKTAGAAAFVLEKYQSKHKSYCENRRKSAVVGATRTLWYGITEHLCLYGAALWLGMMAVNGALSIGETLMFIYLIKRVIMPIEVIFRWMASVPVSIADWERARSLLDTEEESKCDDILPGDVKTLKFRGVSFSYENADNILSDMDLTLKRGEITELAGASGCGKTTALKIAAGLYRGEVSEITADGEPMAAIPPGAVAYAEFENGIFPMSVYDNIALGNTDITRERVDALFSKLGIRDWILELENGADAHVSENSLSGGQKQAIVNIRAIVSGKAVLALDEPFSALDSAREQNLIALLREEKRDRIILMTSHREVEVALSDKIVRM